MCVTIINSTTQLASQSDIAHLTVTASDVVQLTGVSLATLTAHKVALVAWVGPRPAKNGCLSPTRANAVEPRPRGAGAQFLTTSGRWGGAAKA